MKIKYYNQSDSEERSIDIDQLYASFLDEITADSKNHTNSSTAENFFLSLSSYADPSATIILQPLEQQELTPQSSSTSPTDIPVRQIMELITIKESGLGDSIDASRLVCDIDCIMQLLRRQCSCNGSVSMGTKVLGVLPRGAIARMVIHLFLSTTV
jgi:hypothetical protein